MKLSPEALMCGSCCNLAQEFLRTAETRRKEEQDRCGMLWDSFLMGITGVLSVFPCFPEDTLERKNLATFAKQGSQSQDLAPGWCGGSS